MFSIEVLSAVVALPVVSVILCFCILKVKKYLAPPSACKLLINEEKEEEGESGKTLLDNLLSLGYAVPSPCGGKATCHQCKVQVTEGGGDPLDVETMVFSGKKIKEGWRLSCQCKVKESMKVHMDASLMNVSTFKAEVLSNENVSTFIKELCVKVPEDQDISYIPGDYMQVHIPAFKTHTTGWKETIKEKYRSDWDKYSMFDRRITFGEEEQVRAYSLASYMQEKGVLKFTVRIATPPIRKDEVHRRIDWGLGSSYLFSLKPGDKVQLSGPYGESHMIDDDRELIFLIGGAGASFARAHIMDLFYDKDTKRKVTLWYGARSLNENIYEEEFTELAKKFENFSYNLVLSEPTSEDADLGWDLSDKKKTGFVCNSFEIGQLQDMDAPEDALYYICGPPMHNKTVMNLLDNYGVMRSSIVLDDFGS